MKDKRILITGATGLVGANAVKHYLKEGYAVKLLLRKPCKELAYLFSQCKIVFGDITDEKIVEEAVTDCDWVLHAASQVHNAGISMEQYLKVNYEGTKNIVEACIKNKVERLVYISTASIINGGKKYEPATELNDFELVHLNSGYLYSKYLAHQYVMEQVSKCGLDAVILSPTFILGSMDIKPSSGKLLLHAHDKKVLFCPPGRKHYVHVEDVVEATGKSFLNPKSGAHYLICNEGFSYKEFFKKLIELTDTNTLIITLPKWFLLLLGMLGSLYSFITKRACALTYEAAYLLCLENYYGNEKSARELGMNYQDIEKAIADGVEWFVGKGMWKEVSIHPCFQQRERKTLLRTRI